MSGEQLSQGRFPKEIVKGTRTVPTLEFKFISLAAGTGTPVGSTKDFMARACFSVWTVIILEPSLRDAKTMSLPTCFKRQRCRSKSLFVIGVSGVTVKNLVHDCGPKRLSKVAVV